jgi:hypothetical protein
MRPHKQKKLSASRTGPRADNPKTLPGEIILNAAMLASDAGECWKNCQYRSCRNARGCQGEDFGKCAKGVARGPRRTGEQLHRFTGAMHFGIVHLLPKIPDRTTATVTELTSLLSAACGFACTGGPPHHQKMRFNKGSLKFLSPLPLRGDAMPSAKCP